MILINSLQTFFLLAFLFSIFFFRHLP
jgi:hypothetical protein